MSDANGYGHLDFSDLKPVEIPVPIGDEVYTLKPASANSVIAFRTKSAQAAVYGPNGDLVGWKGLADVEPFLVSQCLYDSKGRMVPEAKIRQWTNRVLRGLFKEAFRISDIEERKDPAKDNLVKALSREDSPVKLDDLLRWAASLEPAEEYVGVLKLLTPDADRERQLKNSPTATPASSA